MQKEYIASLLTEAAELLSSSDKSIKISYEADKLCAIFETASNNYFNEVLTENASENIKKGAKAIRIIVAKAVDKLVELIQTLVTKLQSIGNTFLLNKDIEVHKACFGISIGSIISKLKENVDDIELDDTVINKHTEDKINKVDLLKTLHELKRGLQDIKKIESNQNTNKVVQYFNTIIKDINSLINNSERVNNKNIEASKVAKHMVKQNVRGHIKDARSLDYEINKYSNDVKKLWKEVEKYKEIMRHPDSTAEEIHDAKIVYDELLKKYMMLNEKLANVSGKRFDAYNVAFNNTNKIKMMTPDDVKKHVKSKDYNI